MNKKDEFSPELTQVLTHMCNMIEVNYDDVDFSSPTWYWDHTWTMAKEEEFIDWLAKLLYNDTKVRKAILSFPSKDKKRCQAGARFFASMYGWKIITEDLDKLLETK
jgi:glycosyltransferase involved in cell wall biosynthesis